MNTGLKRSSAPVVPRAPAPAKKGVVLRKTPFLESWGVMPLDGSAVPASHFGCVDWYMYEHSDSKAQPGAEQDGTSLEAGSQQS